jgi:hypothetical protein
LTVIVFLASPRKVVVLCDEYTEQWEAVRRYDAMLLEIVRRIVRNGREAGEFERKTPLDEVCHAILLALQPFKHPILLAQNLDSLNQDVAVLSGLVLRSLVP